MTRGDAEFTRNLVEIDNITTTPTKKIYANTEQEVIVVTKDKLHLCLQESVRKMADRDRWQVPLGVLVPLILAVATTGFTKRFGIGGDEWETIFSMLILFTVIWLAQALVKRGKSVTVDSIVEQIARNPVMIENPKSSPSNQEANTGLIVENQSWINQTTLLTDITTNANGADTGDEDPQENEDNELPTTQLILELAPGDTVRHEKFGYGTVTWVKGRGLDAEAKIDFGEPYLTKHLVLRYAPITKIS
jgi:hypothetical protein